MSAAKKLSGKQSKPFNLGNKTKHPAGKKKAPPKTPKIAKPKGGMAPPW